MDVIKNIVSNYKYILPIVFVISMMWFVIAGGTPNKDGSTTKMEMSQAAKHSAYVTALVFGIMYFSKCWSFNDPIIIAPPTF